MKYKKNVYVIVISIVIFCILNLGYKYIFQTKNKINICILTENLNRGDVISEKCVKIISIDKKHLNFINKHVSTNIYGMVAKDTYYVGQIITEDMLLSNEDYLSSNDKEIVSIPITASDDAASYTLQRGSIVNIYYTGKTLQIGDSLNFGNIPSIVSNGTVDSYTTFELISNVKVMGMFDKYGNSAQRHEINDNQIIDTIMIETTKENVIKINNLKNYGTFCVTIVK